MVDLCLKFLQTRGSVPLYWSQRPTLKYKPTPIIDSDVDQVIAGPLLCSLVPRPSVPPVLDDLQYARTEREDLWNLIT